jgi:ribonucleoside-diphosphate reductase alpha chain
MRAFDTATEVIKQGGMRRGANMGILHVHHPDIMKFITAKEDPTAFTNFNLSVAITEDFMSKAEKGENFNLINPRTKEVVGQLNAKDVFQKMVEMAWKIGDPGLVFIDRINRDNPTPQLGEIESTNPCGEQPLLPYESCNLGSLNLSRMIIYKDGKPQIDYDKLGRVIRTAVRFLDNVIEVNSFPIPQITEMTKATRKIGLGVMGFADMLIQLRIPYDSEKALRVAEEVMEFIDNQATQASVELAEERGVFPAFKGSIYDKPGMPRIRNATRTTIAPTGTLSIIAGCSSGIEPLFALSYIRTVLEGERLIEVNPYFEEVARKEGFYSQGLMEELASGKRLKEMEGIPKWVKEVFVTAHDISPEWHIKMQAAFQRHTDNAVSKTVNLPHYATTEDVAKVFWLAYTEGLKGITIYRDRSRESQVLSVPQVKPEVKEGLLTPRRRPKTTSGFTEKVTTGCGNLYITVNKDVRGICEVFTSLGKAGGCASAQLEATSRLISLALRSGVDTASIIKHLKGIRCPSIAWEEGYAVLSCADAIGRVLEKHLEGSKEPASTTTPTAGQCPDCGSLLIYQEGCFHCRNCGYTKCS